MGNQWYSRYKEGLDLTVVALWQSLLREREIQSVLYSTVYRFSGS